jgi:hypothetical protein
MTPFQEFLRGLRADVRLGRYVADLEGKSPELCILLLVLALADAREGRNPHGALELLDRMQSTNGETR